ncbi:nitroreductase family protein [Labilibacter marinus]|uniref:nitroreductase family protein n=1 Tax=Labilibacter marinus TaxID=1477105 RepID=UPI0008295EAD|nr:nitroreductase family protein [Labilibacter marinus]
MNKSHILSLLLAIALFLSIYKLAEVKNEIKNTSESTSSKEEAILSVIHNRKSVRNYTDQPVSDEDITTILKAGMAAPTGFNAQPWQFIVIKDRNTMMELRKELVYARGLDGSPAAIVVCGDMTKVREEAPEFWITDTSAATQNMLLAMEGMGLGGVWSTLYPGVERMAHARKVLNLPEHIMPMCVIPFGYPTGVEKPKVKFDANNIHFEKW